MPNHNPPGGLRLQIIVSVIGASAALACKREARPFGGPDHHPAAARISYNQNAWAMSEGQRLYTQMNCAGCHAHGGGGMGVPLMDGKWFYGFDDAAVFQSITEGRPNGMPRFRDRLSDDQVWQLVAYVKSIGGNASKSVAAARDDHMAIAPAPARIDPQPIQVERRP